MLIDINWSALRNLSKQMGRSLMARGKQILSGGSAHALNSQACLWQKEGYQHLPSPRWVSRGLSQWLRPARSAADPGSYTGDSSAASQLRLELQSIHLHDRDPLLALQEQVPEAGCPGFGCQGPRWEVFTLLFMHFKYRNQLTTGMISEPFYQLIYLFKYFPVQWTIPTCRRQLKTDNKCLVRTLYYIIKPTINLVK